MNTAKRSAASRKAWRTRKRMKAARKMTPNSPEYKKALAARVKKLKTWLKPGMAITFGEGYAKTTVLIVADDDPRAWPEYKRRALPLPEFGK